MQCLSLRKIGGSLLLCFVQISEVTSCIVMTIPSTVHFEQWKRDFPLFQFKNVLALCSANVVLHKKRKFLSMFKAMEKSGNSPVERSEIPNLDQNLVDISRVCIMCKVWCTTFLNWCGCNSLANDSAFKNLKHALLLFSVSVSFQW